MSNPLSMSDEDFLKSEPPIVTEPKTETVVEAAVEKESELASDTEVNSDSETVDTDESKADETTAVAQPVQEQSNPTADVTTDTQSGKTDVAVVDTTKGVDTSLVGSKTDAVAATPNFEDFYQKVMAPFKANGKTIQLQSPEEALQLMQMGANYTRKMQAITPHRKILTMLENNGLMDEGQLSFLIDIQKKNPEAIKKLLKDSGIDPMDVDTSVEPAYQEGNHRVTDDEVAFRTILDDLGSNSEGKETLKEINTRWDQASKEALWKSPDVMNIINQQRESGIYQRIVDGIDRDRTLGKISADVPFLQAYKLVGDALATAGGFDDINQKSVVTKAAPVAVRTAAPKPVVSNADKVVAASASRSSPRKAETLVNPLAMDDDQFLKQMKNRL